MSEDNLQSNQQANLPPKETDTKVIHTYSSDMADAVRQNEMTVIKIALAEQEKHKREEVYKQAEGSGFQKALWIIGGIIFIGLGLAGTYFVIQKQNEDNTPAQVATKNIEAVISYDSLVYVDASNAITTTDMTNILTPELQKTQNQGSIKSIFITKKTETSSTLLTTAELVKKMQISAPAAFTRALADGYMIGTYQTTGANSKPYPFIILQTTNYEQSYAGMLTWEKTMLSDLFTFFAIDVSGDKQDLFQKQFKDLIIVNKDARVLYDDTNKEILYYLFVDKSTLVISNNADAIKEVISRLRTKNTKPL